MRTDYLLKCGSDTVGTVRYDTFENWHNYGRLKPGSDYERYREALEEFLAAEKALDTLNDSEDAVSDVAEEQAQDRKERAIEVLDQFDFYLETINTTKVYPIHDFHPLEDIGSIYWRWGKLPPTPE